MAPARPPPPSARSDRNARAFLVFAVAGVVLYIVLMLVLAGLLEGASDALSRDRFWKIGIYWLVFIAPAVPALWGAARLTVAVVRPFNRPLLYYAATGLLMLGTVVFSLWLIVGGGRGLLLAITAIATGIAAWLALRRVLARSPV